VLSRPEFSVLVVVASRSTLASVAAAVGGGGSKAISAPSRAQHTIRRPRRGAGTPAAGDDEAWWPACGLLNMRILGQFFIGGLV